MTSDEIKAKAARDWQQLDVELREIIVERAESDRAFRHVRRWAYTRGTLVATVVALVVGFRDDLVSLLAWLGHLIGADR